ncbi:MAG: divalent cation tolerance protein CutA [Cytophagales bacterium]|nr:divalent cation tolerance protein CutA [Cytophagales bacterium]
MILLHITTYRKEQVDEIIPLLTKKRLITGVTVVDATSFLTGKSEPEAVASSLIICRSKVLLFSTIERLLKELYGAELPAIYAMPIVNMDLHHEKLLRKRLIEV